MEAPKSGLIFVFFILILSIFVEINGEPQVVLSIYNCSCIVNPEYADPPTCFFNGTFNPSRGHVEIPMRREVKSQMYELNVDIIANKRKRRILHLKKSACEFFEGRVTAILKIIKDIVDDYGELPKKCPVPKDFRYNFKDIVIDSARLPSFIFDGNFHLTTRNTENNKLIFMIEARGGLKRVHNVIVDDKKHKN